MRNLLLEALLVLLAFGLVDANLTHKSALLVPAAATLLCFMMGPQNAVVTKISQAGVRTTHMTGVVTDLGIELGRLLFWRGQPGGPDAAQLQANRSRRRLHAALLASFAGGGLAGALAFQALSCAATVPIAAVLPLLALVPVLDGLQAADRS